MRTTTRLDKSEAEFTSRLKDPASLESEAVRELVGRDDLSQAPAATLVHAIIEAGIEAIKDRATTISYRRAAEVDATDPERIAWARAMRQHRGFGRYAEEPGM